MKTISILTFLSLLLASVFAGRHEIDIEGSTIKSSIQTRRDLRFTPQERAGAIEAYGQLSIEQVCDILEVGPLSESDKTLPGAGELVDVGTQLGSTIGEKIIVIGITIGLDAVIKAAQESLLAILAGGDMTLLPLAIAAFLIKLSIPEDVALQMAEEIYRIISVEWRKVSGKVKQLTFTLLKGFTFALIDAFVRALKAASEAARDPERPPRPDGPWYIPDIE